MPEEAEKYLKPAEKGPVRSAGPEPHRHRVLSPRQVVDNDEHRRLMALRDSKLKDGEVRHEFYQAVIDSLDMEEGNYLILLAHDAYDVPYRGKDGEDHVDEGDAVFSYIVCCVCPVKGGKLELGYCPGENEFLNCVPSQIVFPPELGFLFPAFDERVANLYNALTYARKPDELHQELLDAFSTPSRPCPPGNSGRRLRQPCGRDWRGPRLEVVQAAHERLSAKIEEYREAKDPEPLVVTAKDVADILRDCGAEETQTTAFCEKCGELFGEGAALSPADLIDSKRFEIKTVNAVISIDLEHSYLVETRVINGKRYLLIPAGEGVEVNGMLGDWTHRERE